MSAWYVWSALGFYPVTAGAPVYAIGSPMFEEATIAPVGSKTKVVVKAPSASLANRYIQSATLGQETLDRAWITHDELLGSGSVSFVMGPLANEDWAASEDAAPPSMSSHSLGAFGCDARRSPKRGSR
jgi:putative alpha-1,2-mannosidase